MAAERFKDHATNEKFFWHSCTQQIQNSTSESMSRDVSIHLEMIARDSAQPTTLHNCSLSSLSLSNLRVQTGLSFWTCPARHFSLSIAPRRLAGAWPLVNDDRLADMGWVQDPHSRIRSSYPIHFFKISIPDPVPDPPKFLDQLSFQIQIRICTHVCLLAGQMREEF